MAPQSITIRIDFGSDSAAGGQQAVSVTGGLPTPLPSGASAPGGGSAVVTATAPPTPFDLGGQQLAGQTTAQIAAEAPMPSPDLVPALAAGSAGAAAPTPFDSPEAGRVADQESSAPRPEDPQQIGRTAPPMPESDAARKRGRK